MNERIQELAVQSDLLHHLAKGVPYPSAMTAEKSLAAYKEFAELIIRECAKVVSNVPPCHGDYRDQIEVGIRDYCARKVLEHFGVLE